MNAISFSYNSDGIRTSKTVNGTTTSYVLEGSKVVFETDGSSKIWYYYNASGAPVAFRIGSVLYIYRKNLQGDITGIYSREGNLLVSYSYDAWGAKSSKRRLRRMNQDDFGNTVRKIDHEGRFFDAVGN